MCSEVVMYRNKKKKEKAQEHVVNSKGDSRTRPHPDKQRPKRKRGRGFDE